ncbi:rCG34725 [Rattus norvegicus]|uniref:RCG34725 n=1 Tax=Rattus norvegicus TaxID=10116 RepID=A6HEL3_RAT|nr:rCG34725 [Rattus norvegicus]
MTGMRSKECGVMRVELCAMSLLRNTCTDCNHPGRKMSMVRFLDNQYHK